MMKKLLILFVLSLSTLPFTGYTQTVVDCTTGPINATYCYDNNDNTQLVFTSTTGDPLTLTFLSGETENNFDEVLVLDTNGDNLNAATPYGDGGELAGFSWTSTGDTITLQIQSDGSISCQSGSRPEWNFEVKCQTCDFQTATFDITGDCDTFMYDVNVNVSDFGSASSITISDDQGSADQVITAPGIVNFGPYDTTAEVIFTVANTDDVNCVITSDPQMFACPPPPNECSIVFAGDDVERECDDEAVTLTATYHASGIDTTAYDINVLDSCPLPPTTGGTSAQIDVDDTWSDVIDLGFDFCFFGDTYSQILIGANGVLTFDTSEAGEFCEWNVDDPIPNPAVITNAIFGAYHDINPGTCGTIEYSILGSAPARQFVVNFDNVCHFSCGDLMTSQQIILYETSNNIDVNIFDKPVCTGWNDGNAVIGVQNADGTLGFAPVGRNTSGWSASNEFYRFSPAGVNSSVFEWRDSDGNIIADTETITVTPTEDTTTYTAAVTYTNCDGSDNTVTDEVIVTTGTVFTVDIDGDSVICDSGSSPLTANANGADDTNATYLWSTGETTQTIQVSESGTYTVDVTIGNCSEMGSINVSVSPPIDVTINEGVEIFGCGGSNTILTANSSEPNLTYQWLDEDGTELAGETNMTYEVEIPVSASTRIVRVRVSNGTCTAEASVEITRYDVDNCVITQGISPGITPGFNDCLDLTFLSERTGITSIELFNRYGRSVFKENDYVDSWCGQSSNGDELPTGTYYYVIKLDGEDVVFGGMQTGWVYLNRSAN